MHFNLSQQSVSSSSSSIVFQFPVEMDFSNTGLQFRPRPVNYIYMLGIHDYYIERDWNANAYA